MACLFEPEKQPEDDPRHQLGREIGHRIELPFSSTPSSTSSTTLRHTCLERFDAGLTEGGLQQPAQPIVRLAINVSDGLYTFVRVVSLVTATLGDLDGEGVPGVEDPTTSS